MKNTLADKLTQLGNEAKALMLKAAQVDALYRIRVEYLGKKGFLTSILKDIGTLPVDERPKAGTLANQLKSNLEEEYQRQLKRIESLKIAESLDSEKTDVTLPGLSSPRGRLHPLSRVLSEMTGVFLDMGFDVYEGPEIETDYYNFEALNIPAGHPARDMQDTFYLNGSTPLLLRTHTSPVQIHVMEENRPPIQMIAPGVVYRRDSDISHSPMFHQIEGLMVSEGVTLGNLKAVIELFLKKIFKPETEVRFRPSYFPFTEPSAEVDIQCIICRGGGCRVCRQSGWMEIMGCGMVDPAVFHFVKINPEKYSGFAFGIGVERVAMIKYGIDDIRLFYENDKRFLNQF